MRTKLAKKFKAERPCTDSENESRSLSAKRPDRQKLAQHRSQLREQNEKLAQLKEISKRSFAPILSRHRSDSECSTHVQKPRSINIGIGRHQDGKICRTPHTYHVLSREEVSPQPTHSHQAEVEGLQRVYKSCFADALHLYSNLYTVDPR